jgi:hypothetical protein
MNLKICTKAKEGVIIYVFMLAFGFWAVSLGQDINGDLLGYHFYNGYAFLHNRYAQDMFPAMMQTYVNPFLDIINYLLVSLHEPKLAMFFMGAFSGLAAYFLYKIANILFLDLPYIQRYQSIFLALLIATTGSGSISLLGTSTNDTKTSLLVLASLYFLALAIKNIQANCYSYVLIAGLIAGLSAGFKLPAACFAVASIVAYWWVRPRFYYRNYQLTVLIIATLVGFLLAEGYWSYVLYHQFQNPFFPFYNNFFQSEFAPLYSFNINAGNIPLDFFHKLLAPVYLALANNKFASEKAMCDWRFLCCFILLAIYLVLSMKNKKKGAMIWNFLLTYFVVAYVVWLYLFAVYRYALPLELLSGIIIVFLLQKIYQNLNFALLTAALLALVLMLTTQPPNWGRMPYGPAYFSMNVPRIATNSIIILTSTPLSYVIPFFPEQVRFIGMPFIVLQGQNKLIKIIQKQLLQSKDSPRYTLSYAVVDKNDQRSMKILNQFGLSRDEKNCLAFTTNVGDTLRLCLLREIPI